MTAAITALVQQFEHGIRRIVVSGVTYYSLVDMCAVLTDTKDANIYWRDTKRRLKKDGFESWESIPQFKLPAADGKYRLTDCATAETCLRIVQAIPSPKAEPLRRWFARVAVERIEEIANPELGIQRSRQRAVEAYQERGLPADWIAARLKGIGDRNHFTDAIARNVRGMTGEDYAAATNSVYEGLWGCPTAPTCATISQGWPRSTRPSWKRRSAKCFRASPTPRPMNFAVSAATSPAPLAFRPTTFPTIWELTSLLAAVCCAAKET